MTRRSHNQPFLLPGGAEQSRRIIATAVIVAEFACAIFASRAKAIEAGPDPATVTHDSTAGFAAQPAIYIREYRVTGARQLERDEVESAVYPFLGPERTAEDVEQARAALEEAYKAKGFQTVTVEVPQQDARGGIIRLQVVEAKVGRLRVKGARFYLPSAIKARARSLAEGKVVNFNDVTRDIVALNQLPDRRITPNLRPGIEPGTVDIDLEVKDTLPLHGSIELNNRYSADTTELRLNGSLSYNNLWQLGHSIGGSVQVSPQDLDEVKVISGYYLARLPDVDWLSLILQGVKQESNVSTLGAIGVAGRGEVMGARAIFTLPSSAGFYHSLSVGMDYKHFNNQIELGLVTTETPITYYPASATYSATWAGKQYTTDLNAGLIFSFRGLGSNQAEFDSNRFRADGSFIYFRGDASHTHELPLGFQGFAKVQAQIASQPLVSSEQFGGGGLGTVRGYLEAEVLGDNALAGTLEFRSPNLLSWLKKKNNEWRIHAFADAGVLTLNDPLPEQEDEFTLATIGIGSRIQLLENLHGSIDAGFPLISQTQTLAHNLLLTFRVWAEF
jgi:hemolysin activation/secretion protein